MKNPRFISLALVSGLLLATSAGAQVLLSDTFSDGNRSGQALPGSAAWFISSATSSNAGVTSGVLTTNSGLSITSYFAASGSPFTLATAGQTLTLTFDIAYASNTDPTGNTALKLGLFNSNGNTRLTADGTNNIFVPYSGYAVTAGYTTNSSIRERATGLSNTALLTSTSGYTVVGTSSFTFGITDTPEPNYYNGLFSITRTAAGHLEMTYTLTQASNPSNSWSYTVTDTTPVTFGFDTVSFSTSSGTNMYLDNITLTATAIPEPSTYALGSGALALLAACLLRRRRS